MRVAPALAITEKEWDYQLFNSRNGLATTLGWKLSYHTLRSKGSPSGFPDRALVRDRLIMAELKSQTGQPTATQIEWLDGLALAGVESYLLRPADLDETARILGFRWTFQPFKQGGPALTNPSIDTRWQPRALWIPGQGRADSHQQTVLEEGAA